MDDFLSPEEEVIVLRKRVKDLEERNKGLLAELGNVLDLVRDNGLHLSTRIGFLVYGGAKELFDEELDLS